MELHRCYAAHTSPALPQHWPPNLRDSREVLGDSNRKSPLCDRCRLFSFAELRDGWQYGPGASICVSLFRHLGGNSSSCLHARLALCGRDPASNMLGCLVTVYIPPFAPSLPPFLPLPSASGPAAKAVPPKMRLAILCSSKAERPSGLIKNRHIDFGKQF